MTWDMMYECKGVCDSLNIPGTEHALQCSVLQNVVVHERWAVAGCI